MPDILETRYNHREIEPKIYELWEKSGYFDPDKLPIPHTLNPKPFCIIMPPPNANGSLHIGHAVFVTLQDIMIRLWRMTGRKTLWLPGADHAGFETQVVFDKKLEKEGRSRFQMSREEQWQEIWEFTQKNKKVMESQLRTLGASCDWSREKFTLDPDIVQKVQKTFVKLYEDGLIYRGTKLVNWCAKHQTALSDLEVKYLEKKDALYYIAYGPLTVATVRPETIFGDVAVAVNPKDNRYKNFIGKKVPLPLTNREIPVISDEAVDQSFGTGIVKITPAHDQADFEIAGRHNLPIIQVIDKFGRLNEKTGEYRGLKIKEAREKVVADLKGKNLLQKIDENYEHNVSVCYKCETPLEPMILPQWFVKMQSLAKKAIEVVKKGKIKFVPDRFKKVYFHWLENIRDWNISRQIIWGIRIPAWLCVGCGAVKINPEIKSRWFIVRHGETDFNKERRATGSTDVPLNETGRIQAKKAGELLKGQKIDLIISSDLKRAHETAKIIAETTGAKIILDQNLRERDYGKAEGMLVEEIEKVYKDFFQNYYENKSADNESYRELEERIWTAFKNHRENHLHKNIVIVSHGGAIRILLKKLKNMGFEDVPSNIIANAQPIQLDITDEHCEKCGGDIFEQDPDVFDTWFSSGQWPFLTLGFKGDAPAGKQSEDFKTFYPTDVMETGWDILFFWVARMIMMGLYRTGKIPFKTVYLHGLVRDKDRQKMSKSKGNVIDPLGVAEVYGADALRMALIAGNTPGNDIIISEDKIRGYRNFTTKIWNIARLILMRKIKVPEKPKLTKEDQKNLDDLKKIKSKVTKHIEKFEFHLAAETAYHYVWHTFADKIIETSKNRLLDENNPSDRAAAYFTLETILLECLKILHPFMPFVTEAIYQIIKPGKILMIEKW